VDRMHLLLQRLDFNLYPRRQIERRENLDHPLTRIEDVNDSLVDAYFKLLAAVLVNKRSPIDSVALRFGRQRNWPLRLYPLFNQKVNQLMSVFIDQPVVIRLQPDPELTLNFRFRLSHWRVLYLSLLSFEFLLNYFSHHASADGSTTLANGEA